MNKSDLIDIRDYDPSSDKSFIFASWLKGLYYGDTWFKEIPKNVFMKNYHVFIEQLLNDTNTVVKIACLKEDKDVILGYAVFNKAETVLHWVFIKTAWRSVGIMKIIVPKNIKTVTHLTKLGLSLLRKNQEVIFNPFAIKE